VGAAVGAVKTGGDEGGGGVGAAVGTVKTGGDEEGDVVLSATFGDALDM